MDAESGSCFADELFDKLMPGIEDEIPIIVDKEIKFCCTRIEEH